MLIIDELVTENQRQLLLQNKINVKQIGYEIGTLGMSDSNIIKLLHQLQSPTFFTRDSGFYNTNLVHSGYSIVMIQIDRKEVFQFISKFLKLDRFSTNGKRMGKVVCLSKRGIKYYEKQYGNEIIIEW